MTQNTHSHVRKGIVIVIASLVLLSSPATAAAGDIAWSYDTNESQYAIVTNHVTGYVYAGGTDNTLRKIDPSDGSIIWTRNYGNTINALEVSADGTQIYVGEATSGDVLAVWGNGTTAWTHTGQTDWINALAVNSKTGMVYSASADGTLYGIYPNGSSAWLYGFFTEEVGGLDYDPVNDRVLAAEGTYNGIFKVHAIEPDAPEQIWNKSYPSFELPRALEIDDRTGYFYIAANSGLHKFNSTGHNITEYGGWVYDIAIDEDAETGYIAHGENMRALDISGDGIALRWTFSDPIDGVNEVSINEDTSQVGLVTGYNDGRIFGVQGEPDVEYSYLSGNVVNQTYNALPNASIEIYDSDKSPFDGDTPRFSGYTDNLGNYEIEVTPNTYNIYYSKHNYDSVYKTYVDLSDNRTINTVLHKANYTVSGQVTDKQLGIPVTNATVTFYTEEMTEGGIPQIFSYSTQTDLAGYYQMEIPADTYNQTYASHGNYETAYRNDTIISANRNIDYTLNQIPNTYIDGHVYDNSTLKSLSNARVTVGGYETFTNETGYYNISVLEGDYDIAVSKPGYHPDYRTDLAINDTTEDFYLDKDYTAGDGTPDNPVVGNNTLYGYVTNGTGIAIDGATIEVAGLATQSDDSGYYAFELANGTYDFTVFKDGYQTLEVTGINVSGDTQQDFTLLKDANATYYTINGVVKSEGSIIDKPLSNAIVKVGPYSDATNGVGEYSITVPDGTYDISASKDKYATSYLNDTRVNENKTLDFTLIAEKLVKKYTVSGYITNSKGEYVEDALISFANNQTQTDRHGYYEIQVLEAYYNVTVEKMGYDTTHDNLTYIDRATTLNYTLYPHRWIEIHAPGFMEPDENSTFAIVYYNPAYDTETDITQDAVITSSNSSILLVNQSGGMLHAQGINGTIMLNASYDGFSDSQKVFVAQPTIDNIKDLPATQWVPVMVGTVDSFDDIGQPFHWIFVAIVIGALFGGLLRNSYVGLGAIVMVMTFALIVNSIGLGLYLATLYFAIFLSINEYKRMQISGMQ